MGRVFQWTFLLFFLLFLSRPASCFGEDESKEIMRGVMSSFSVPLRDLFKKEHPSEWRNLFHGLSGSFAFDLPVQQKPADVRSGSGSSGATGNIMDLRATLRYNPFSYWFFQSNFYVYPNPGDRAHWNPDFTYAFGYDDWHPYTFSLVYSNYMGNHFFPNRQDGEVYTRFEQGTFSLGWKYVLPRFLEQWFIVHPSGSVGLGFYYNATPSYYDQLSNGTRGWKQSLSLAVKYTIYKWFYINAVFYFYPDPSQQQPWDPDFSYGFGYFDWHPGTISIQYNNYSGTRYPWRSRSPNTGGFEDGSFSISYSWAW